jgi:hypothetical protein
MAAVQSTTPTAKLGFRPALSATQLQAKPPINCPTELMMLNADCQFAGRTASPWKIYLQHTSILSFSRFSAKKDKTHPKSRLKDGTPIMAPFT